MLPKKKTGPITRLGWVKQGMPTVQGGFLGEENKGLLKRPGDPRRWGDWKKEKICSPRVPPPIIS